MVTMLPVITRAPHSHTVKHRPHPLHSSVLMTGISNIHNPYLRPILAHLPWRICDLCLHFGSSHQATPPICCRAFLFVTTIRCRSILIAPPSSRTLSERPTTSRAVP